MILYLRISIRCSNGRGLFVRDTSFVRHVAASNWEYDDCEKRGKSVRRIFIWRSVLRFKKNLFRCIRSFGF